ncbi:hypothetical protein [Christiangramia sediminis]|uniref:Lipoprotein n=1 Tax=Christiangramia sediminis TaxID=2881336 RepID=A0A9X1LJI2_9FLAO|nr:hypothetical protein [Christiangramia sediminis]MCB7481540.1 hypothetical protein [Christiangramia sediminis]
MKIRKLSLFFTRFILLIFLGISIVACQDKEKKEEKNEVLSENKKENEVSKSNMIEIVTNSMEFKTRDQLESGWHTFKYKNKSNETHFVVFEKYPEGKGVENAKSEIIPAFQEGMNAIISGNPEQTNAAFAKIPEWFQEVEFSGGVGLISAKSEAQSTLYLEPGTYIIECYVKMPGGIFHSTQGMIKEIQVTPGDSSDVNITEDYSISIDAKTGISFDERVSPGKKTFKVKFGEQKIHENFSKHDVHLVWVDQGADLSALNSWMNWANPEGLQTPAPAGFKFLGGMQELNEGGTGYFTAELKPGNYALISEIPDSQTKGMLKTFKVE